MKYLKLIPSKDHFLQSTLKGISKWFIVYKNVQFLLYGIVCISNLYTTKTLLSSHLGCWLNACLSSLSWLACFQTFELLESFIKLHLKNTSKIQNPLLPWVWNLAKLWLRHNHEIVISNDACQLPTRKLSGEAYMKSEVTATPTAFSPILGHSLFM